MLRRRHGQPSGPLMPKLIKLVIALWFIGLAVFIAKLPSSEAPPPVAGGEGIIVPTGGGERVVTGFRLLSQGGKRLLITGVHPDTTLGALAGMAGAEASPCCVDLDYTARDTIGNAAYAAEWVGEHQFQTVRLVTSWYHMPRSVELFQRAMPDLTIVEHPVSSQEMPREGWWQNPEAWQLVVGEYIKLLWAWVA